MSLLEIRGLGVAIHGTPDVPRVVFSFYGNGGDAILKQLLQVA